MLDSGAHILWRASASFRLTPIQVLREGSYLAKLYPARKPDGPPITVRVIEYTVHTTATNGGTEETSEVFALVTDLLDSEAYPVLGELGRRRGAAGCGPFPSARSRTGRASFPRSRVAPTQ